MSYKTTDGLMRHLRDNGIAISGSKEKRQLINTGYFHGYKGYRYFKRSDHPIAFTSYNEIYSTIEYDAAIKTLLYPKVMFIETAVKNIALESIMIHSKSESLQAMYDRAIESYKTANNDKKGAQENKLKLQSNIQSSISRAYKKGDPKITHYYESENHNGVPIWALFEILMMGDFGELLKCLTYEIRDDISKRLGFNLSLDTDRKQIYSYIFILKDLRNAVAHNNVVFDARFKNYTPPKCVLESIKKETGLKYCNFDSIDDYIILVAYFMKLLKVSKNEINRFVKSFESSTEKYMATVNENVQKVVVRDDYKTRLNIFLLSV